MTPGTAKHVLHHREHEAFFVLEGEVSVTVAGQQRSLRTGQLLHAPRDVPHHFTNPAAAPARLLVWAVPAGLEKFFAELRGSPPVGGAMPATPTPQEIARLLAIAPKYGLEILAPR